ncbi:LysR family transcriptional regulator [Secundilactobacillus mixtipabuli]|uniref:LysR family transcriptional regulator n=1 Tax=Secundilactobacillus mixtipabuli TaxID=1435342 RepID=A0A1Z5IA43_9LACO|nr:LysR family transcriptional regulator [Secundilactobacillus mixtipabuli]GAW98497.1 LysR family transcriptional regulator [Secundilactobacillus mixtipabuli]
MSKNQILSQILTECQHCRTITQVASNLYVSQPYVSQILQAAEKQYHVALVNRDVLPIQVTLAGIKLLKHLTQLIEDQHDLENEMALFSTKHQGKVLITFNQPMATLMAPELFKPLEAGFPDVLFEFDEQTTYLAKQSLLEGKANLFVGAALNDQNITTLPITHDERPLIIIPKSTPLYSQLRPEDDFNENLNLFENADFIGLLGQSYYQDLIELIFSDNHIDINIRLRVPNLISATLTALHSSASTATLPFILPRLQIPRDQYRLLSIPETHINAQLSISYKKDASQLTQTIAKTLQDLIAKFYTKKNKTLK